MFPRIRWPRIIRGMISLAMMIAGHAAFAGPVQLPHPIANRLLEALSGERARHHVMMITRYHRVQASPGYRRAAEYVLSQLKAAGFDEQHAWMESFPSDGRVQYQTWQSPAGWWIDEAELRVVEPEPQLLVRYPDIAMSLITYSNPGDVTAELVWVGEGTRDEDYQGKDVRGKFVLATGYGGSVHRLAVLKYGARAVVCYLDDERSMRHPDMVQYTGMWPKTEELDRVTFGFNISRRQGEMLRHWLESGKRVVLHGWARGRGLHAYAMDVVVARIEGTDPDGREIVFSAHLDHPRESANDNASGSAALLDMAITLKRLVDEGKLPGPRFTFRFLWVPEWNGTMAYIDRHPDLKGPALHGKFVANFNLDMVGEDLEKLHSRLLLVKPPDSIPSVLSDVVAAMAAYTDEIPIRSPRGGRSAMNYRVVPYTGGSDHMMFVDRKIPAMMFFHDPDYTHHTSDDTPDKVDPVELKRSMFIALGSALYLDRLAPDTAEELLKIAFAHAVQAVMRRVAELEKMIRKAAPERRRERLAYTRDVLDHLEWREREHLRSILTFVDSKELRLVLSRMTAQLNRLIEAERTEIESRWGKLPPPVKGDRRIPVRLTRGPLAFDLPERKLPDERVRWYREQGHRLDNAVRFEIVNFIDGHRNIHDIARHVSAEFGPIPEKVVARYIEDLVSIGVLRWKK